MKRLLFGLALTAPSLLLRGDVPSPEITPEMSWLPPAITDRVDDLTVTESVSLNGSKIGSIVISKIGNPTLKVTFNCPEQEVSIEPPRTSVAKSVLAFCANNGIITFNEARNLATSK